MYVFLFLLIASPKKEANHFYCHIPPQSLSFISNFLPAPPKGSPSSPSVLASGLGSISSHISMCRYVLRIVTGIPSSVEGTVNNSWVNGPTKLPPSKSGSPRTSECSSPFVNALEHTMPMSMLAYYPIEHVAYCAWLAPKLFTSPETIVGRFFENFKEILQPDIGDFFSAASCFAWFWYIVADLIVQGERIIRLGDVVKKLEEEDKEDPFRSASSDDSAESVDEGDRSSIIKSIKTDLLTAKLTFTRELIYVVPCLHWMNPYYGTQPLMSKKQISVFMFAEAIVSFYQGWNAQKGKEEL